MLDSFRLSSPADEEVTFYYDMTDVGFQEGVDLYLWAWQPTEPDAVMVVIHLTLRSWSTSVITFTRRLWYQTQYFNSDVSKFEDDAWPGFGSV